MRQRTKIASVLPLAMLFVVQLVLPLVVGWSLSLLHERQRSFVEANKNDDAVFQQIVIAPGEDGVRFAGQDELCYHGKWYDIRSIEQRDGRLVVSMLADERETNIRRQQEGQSDFDPEHLYPVPFCFLYYEAPQYWTARSQFFCGSRTYFASASEQMLCVTLNVPNPPPEHFC